MPAVPAAGLVLLAAITLGGCDLNAPAIEVSPSVDVSFPPATPPVAIPSPSPVRPPQSPPAGAPAPD